MAIDRLAQLAIDIVVNSGRAAIQMRNIKTTFDRTATAVNRLNNRMNSAFISTGLLLSTKQLFEGFISTIIQLNDEFIKLEKLIIDIDKIAKSGNLQKLSETFINLTDTLAIASLEEVGKTMQAAARSGLKLNAGLEELTATAVRFSKVSDDITPEDAALGLSRLAINFKLSRQEIERIGASIDNLSDSFPTTSGEILKTTARLSGLAQAAGLTAAQTAGLSAVFLKAGISQTVARTTITRLFTQLQDDPLKVAEALNLTEKAFIDFATLIKQKPIEGIKAFIAQLNRIGPRAAQEALKTLGISSSRLQQALAILKVDLAQVDKAQRLANQAFKEGNNLLEKEFKVMQTASAQVVDLTNKWSLFQASLAQTNTTLSVARGMLSNVATVTQILNDKFQGNIGIDVGVLSADNLKQAETSLGIMNQRITKILGELEGRNKAKRGASGFGLADFFGFDFAETGLKGQLEQAIKERDKLLAVVVKQRNLAKGIKEDELGHHEIIKRKLEALQKTRAEQAEINRLIAVRNKEIDKLIGEAPSFGPETPLGSQFKSIDTQVEFYKNKILETGKVSERLAAAFRAVTRSAEQEKQRLSREEFAGRRKDLIGELIGGTGVFGQALTQIQDAQKLFNNPILQGAGGGIQAAIADVLGLQLRQIGQQNNRPPQAQFSGLTEAWKKAQTQVSKKDNALRAAQLRLAMLLIPLANNEERHRTTIENLLTQINQNLGGGEINP